MNQARDTSEQSLIGTLYKHRRTGRVYSIVMLATVAATGEESVVYRSLRSGRTWIRPSAEFFDGRFSEEPVAAGATNDRRVVDRPVSRTTGAMSGVLAG